MPSGSKLQKRVAVIFAGGKSSRMKEDKSLLPFGGNTTLCEYQFGRLKELFEEVYISTKEPKFGFEASLILDNYPQSSPLIGLISLFETIPESECFVLSVDAPFVDKTVIDTLYAQSSDNNYDAIIAQSPRGIEPLCGIYRASILPIAKELALQNNHRLSDLLKKVKTNFVKFESNEPFENINHPHQYQAALKREHKE